MMKIMIEMEEEKYKWIKKNNPNAKPDSIVGAVVHGTPITDEEIADASIIIEADKEV